jgi:hypothetical protein
MKAMKARKAGKVMKAMKARKVSKRMVSKRMAKVVAFRSGSTGQAMEAAKAMKARKANGMKAKKVSKRMVNKRMAKVVAFRSGSTGKAMSAAKAMRAMKAGKVMKAMKARQAKKVTGRTWCYDCRHGRSDEGSQSSEGPGKAMKARKLTFMDPEYQASYEQKFVCRRCDGDKMLMGRDTDALGQFPSRWQCRHLAEWLEPWCPFLSERAMKAVKAIAAMKAMRAEIIEEFKAD